MIEVYVDGSYDRETNKAGAGIVIITGITLLKKSIPIEIGEKHSWNIEGETAAVIEALKIIERENLEGKITINYDYEGIEKWANREWKTKSRVSREYFMEYNKIVLRNNFDVSFNKIKAHSGDQYNDLADELAKEACK